VLQLGSLGLCAVSTLSTQYGAGRHLADLPPEEPEASLKLMFATAIIYQSTLGLLKVSICLFYLRLFVDHRARRLVIASIVWIALFTIPSLALWVAVWKPMLCAARAKDPFDATKPTFYLNAVGNILTDIWLISFISPKIWSLNLPTREKAGLLFVLTLGWLATVAAIVRVVRVTQVTSQEGIDVTCK
jgi:hypothetical protein